MGRYFSMINEQANRRPKYTKYEIAKLVKQKIEASQLALNDFCIKFDIDSKILTDILAAKRSFNKKILNSAAVILDTDIRELLSEEVDAAPAFRSKDIKEETIKTVDIANLLFNEIIMQKKISV